MRLRENPVLRHGSRWAGGRAWPLGVLAALFAAGFAGLLIERWFMALPEYSPLAPPRPSRTLAVALLGESAVLLAWGVLRVVALWRRLVLAGQIEEYRRSRLSAADIAGGALLAALTPPLVACAASLALTLALRVPDAPRLGAALTVHALLLAQLAAYGALALWLAGRFRHPGLALPAALLALAGATGLVAVVDAFVPRLADPFPWIYAALLPNPVTAVGNALDTDVLRFGWLYERLRIPEYFFVYPPWWQTAGLYAAAAAAAFHAAVRRIRG